MCSTCHECGAAIPDGASCKDYFHELLALEAQVPGAAGALPHFLAVASYKPPAPIAAALAGQPDRA